MKNASTALALEFALSPGIIACVAGAWKPGMKYCLPLKTAARVIEESGSHVLVLHMPLSKKIDKDQSDALNFSDLLAEIRIPVSRFSLFVNTSFCQTREDVDQMIAIIYNLWDVEPYRSTASIFLKLEILDDMLRPKDEETCAIFDDYPLEVRKLIIPFLTGDIDTFKHAVSKGCPAIRIWNSGIGQSAGIIDEPRLKRVVASTEVPLILEGGLATPKHVQMALQLGFKAALLNSAFRLAVDPVKLAKDIRRTIDCF